MNLRAFVGELRRRRVTRMAVVYIVVGFGVLQAADLILPRLLLPDWTVTLVLVLALLGFPVAIALAWALEVTPDGIRRAPPVAADAEPGTGRRIRRRVRASFAVLVTAIVAFAGWLALRGGGVADDVAPDRQLIAVMPFRVQGVDASLAYLREGMADLLAARLTGTPRAVDVRAVMSAYERELRDDDATPDRVAPVARGLGAARFVTGSVVGSPARLSVSVALHDARTGRSIVDATVDGPADSLGVIAGRLVTQLLGRELREAEHRLDILGSTAFPVVRLYLEGKSLYRRGLYDEATERFAAALSMDSTFALAALGLAEAANMTFASGGRAYPAMLSAWEHRDRLSPADRRYLLARLGPNHPEPSTIRDFINGWEQLTHEQPDRAEVWYEYADILHHRGTYVGIADNLQRADNMFDRALQLDPGFFPAMQHKLFSAAMREDSATATRIGLEYLAVDSVGMSADFTRVLMLRARRDSASLARVANALEAMNHEMLVALASTQIVPPLPEWDSGLARVRQLAWQRARSAEEVNRILQGQYSGALTGGRPAEAAKVMERLLASAPSDTLLLHRAVLAAIYWDGDSAQGARAAADLERIGPRPDGSPLATDAACSLAQWHLWNGHGESAAESARRMRATVSGRPATFAQWRAHVCAALLDAGSAVLARRGNARELVLAFDSLMMLGPPIADEGRLIGNLAAMRLLDMLGEAPRAFAASRREVHGPGYHHFLSTRLRERARLADAVGDTATAERTYREYLAFRRNAEPAMVERDRIEVEALARISGERRQPRPPR